MHLYQHASLDHIVLAKQHSRANTWTVHLSLSVIFKGKLRVAVRATWPISAPRRQCGCVCLCPGACWVLGKARHDGFVTPHDASRQLVITHLPHVLVGVGAAASQKVFEQSLCCSTREGNTFKDVIERWWGSFVEPIYNSVIGINWCIVIRWAEKNRIER